ncbi:hypothetical protein CRUP_007156 [Coryphaenoides rupestris]|nr:hypothetical protein CRUP_007156 [Coryphaenoides rupestris]
MSIDKLFPALVECFGIILCGYIAGRAGIITGSQAKGLGNFVSRFALPALLFKNMVLLDFGDVIWAFLWSILIAKVATYPEYLQYIYLVAPISLMFLNPIGFALCEVQQWRRASGPQRSTLSILGVAVLQVLKNPIVLVMPLICKEMVEILDVGGANSSSANHSSLSNLAFLYGAPSVALYAAQFNMELEVFLVCVSMILWNFVVQQEEVVLSKVMTFILLYGSLYSSYIWAEEVRLTCTQFVRYHKDQCVLDIVHPRRPVLLSPVCCSSSWSVPQEKMSSMEVISDSMEPVRTQMKLYGIKPVGRDGGHRL